LARRSFFIRARRFQRAFPPRYIMQMDLKRSDDPIKETCRRIRIARSYWDAHNNAACRMERARALELYDKLTKEQKKDVPQVLRIWLRYRSEKYFGEGRTPHR